MRGLVTALNANLEFAVAQSRFQGRVLHAALVRSGRQAPRGCFSKSFMYLVFVADGQLFLCGALEHIACMRVCMCDLYTTLIGIGLCMHVVHSVSCVVELKRQRQRPQADPRPSVTDHGLATPPKRSRCVRSNPARWCRPSHNTHGKK